MVVVGLPAGKTLDDLIADAKAKGPESEDDWLHFGEIGEANTGATGVGSPTTRWATTPSPCWQEGKAGGGKGPVHASIGMAKAFTAAASASAPQAAAPPRRCSVSKFTYQGIPDTVPAGKPFTLAFTDKESFEITHEWWSWPCPRARPSTTWSPTPKPRTRKRGRWLHFGEIGEVNTGATGVGTSNYPLATTPSPAGRR